MQVRFLWVLLATVALLPTATAIESEVGFYNPFEPTPATMYIHLVDNQDAPINTQIPDSKFFSAPDIGLAQHSQGCVDNPTGTLISEPHHTSYAYSSPSYVEYNYDEGGIPRIHKERGISYDVELEPNSEVMFHWYMESQWRSTDGEPNINSLPAFVPNVVVRATIREGDDISVGEVAYNSGELIAQGESDPVNIAGPVTGDHPHATYENFGERHVYGFHFPLEIERHQILREEAYNVRVDVYLENPVCDDVHSGDYMMPDFLRLHTSPGHRPHFEWSIMNPLRVDSLHPQMVGEDLVFHAHVNSVWGNYDVGGDDFDAITHPTLEFVGDSLPVVLDVPVRIGDFHAHGPETHIKPTMAVWSWATIEESPADGEYRVSLTITNDQGTNTATAVAAFELGDSRLTSAVKCEDNGCAPVPIPKDPVDVESPGLPVVGLLAALATLGIVRRK